MAKKEKAVSPEPKGTSEVSLADILRKGNLSVPDPGPVRLRGEREREAPFRGRP